MPRRDTSAGLTYYHELDDTFYSVTSNTFIGTVYNLFGLKNIADGGPAGNDYPQLSSEFIVQQNPDLIFLADSKCCQQDAATVAARPGWDAITAVKNGTGVIADGRRHRLALEPADRRLHQGRVRRAGQGAGAHRVSAGPRDRGAGDHCRDRGAGAPGGRPPGGSCSAWSCSPARSSSGR